VGKKRFGPPIISWGVLLLFSLTAIPASASGRGKITGTTKVRGVKNPQDVVIYIEKVEGQFQPPKTPVVLDQIKLTYIPHVLVVLVGSTIEFRNSDNVVHNVRTLQKRGVPFNILIPRNRKLRRTLKEEGIVTLLCDIHTEMSAYVVVAQNPFFTKPDDQGNYRIENVPPGTYTLVAWHEKRKSQKKEIKVPNGGEVRVNFELRR